MDSQSTSTDLAQGKVSRKKDVPQAKEKGKDPKGNLGKALQIAAQKELARHITVESVESAMDAGQSTCEYK